MQRKELWLVPRIEPKHNYGIIPTYVAREPYQGRGEVHTYKLPAKHVSAPSLMGSWLMAHGLFLHHRRQEVFPLHHVIHFVHTTALP